MKFARRVFLLAGLYGMIVILPQFFLENRIGRGNPPQISHPEYFYGFVGIALAWQIAFLIISFDPVRYRPMMLAGIVEKATFGFACVALFLEERLSGQMLAAGLFDLFLGALFLVAWWKVRTKHSEFQSV